MGLAAAPGTAVYAVLALGFSLTRDLGSRFSTFSILMTTASFVASATR
jgi:hypothetical protein